MFRQAREGNKEVVIYCGISGRMLYICNVSRYGTGQVIQSTDLVKRDGKKIEFRIKTEFISTFKDEMPIKKRFKKILVR